jgi:hypothetical protein
MTVENDVHLSHPDRAKLEECLEAYDKGRLLSYFAPPPAEEPPEGWSLWKDNNWTTDWEIEQNTCCEWEGDNELYLGFHTRWSPPLAAYDAAAHLGFTVDAKYHEHGGQAGGLYEPGVRHTRTEYVPNEGADDNSSDDYDDWIVDLEERIDSQDFTGWTGGTYKTEELPSTQVPRAYEEPDDNDDDLKAFHFLANNPRPWTEEQEEEFDSFFPPEKKAAN